MLNFFHYSTINHNLTKLKFYFYIKIKHWCSYLLGIIKKRTVRSRNKPTFCKHLHNYLLLLTVLFFDLHSFSRVKYFFACIINDDSSVLCLKEFITLRSSVFCKFKENNESLKAHTESYN